MTVRIGKNCSTTFLTAMIAVGGVLVPGLSSKAATVQTGGVEIRLWSGATVTDGRITLGQVATITGDPTQIAGIKNLTLATGLIPGRKVQLRAWQVAEQLGEAGFDVGKITFTGAAACAVDYVAKDPTKGKETGLPADQESRMGGPASLESHLRSMICGNLRAKGLPKESPVKISFSSALGEVLGLTDPPYRFEIVPQRNSSGLGLVGFKVKIFRDSALLQSLPILAEVQVRMGVLVASKVINSKARIGKQDIERNEREISVLNNKLMTNPQDVVGQQAKKMIHPGMMITSDLLESVPIVRRGQLVTVLYHKGGLDIRIVGKALSNAFMGEVIQVRNERSKEVFRAKVTGEGQVMVEEINP